MAELKDQIKQDMLTAMRSKDKDTLAVIRMLQAAIKQKEVDERTTLGDAETLAVIEKMIKQRQESIKQFEQGNRPELAAKEQQEIDQLKKYMPAPLAEEELNQLIQTAIKDTGANSVKDMGKVMQQLKSQIQGRANMGEVSNKVKTLLAG